MYIYDYAIVYIVWEPSQLNCDISIESVAYVYNCKYDYACVGWSAGCYCSPLFIFGNRKNIVTQRGYSLCLCKLIISIIGIIIDACRKIPYSKCTWAYCLVIYAWKLRLEDHLLRSRPQTIRSAHVLLVGTFGIRYDVVAAVIQYEDG